MYTTRRGTLGFAGGYAYRERPTGASQSLYTLAMTGTTLAETTAQRVQYPSYFQSQFTGTGVSVAEKKFITYNNTAVTELTLTNTGTDPVTKTMTVSSPIATTASSGDRAHRLGDDPLRADHRHAAPERRRASRSAARRSPATLHARLPARRSA